MGGTVAVVRGASRDVLRQVRDRTGAPFAPVANPSPFDGSEPLACLVWPGDQFAAVATPAASWVDAVMAKYLLTFAAADTSVLSPGLYRFETTAVRGGRTGVVDRGRLHLLAAPATGLVAPTFTVLADLLHYCPWVEDLQPDDAQFAFSGEQLRATNWLIDTLVQSYQPAGLAPQQGQPGWNAMSIGWGSGGPAPSKWLRDVITPLVPNSTIPATLPDRTNTAPNLIRPGVSAALLLYDSVLECCAKRALSYVFGAQVGRDNARPYAELARGFGRDASSLFRATRFEIDLSVPQTGWASVTIHGGAGSLR